MKKIIALLTMLCLFVFSAVSVNAGCCCDEQKNCTKQESVQGNIIDAVKGTKCDCCKEGCTCGDCDACKAKCDCCDKCTCGCKEGKPCACNKCKVKSNKKCKCKKGCKVDK